MKKIVIVGDSFSYVHGCKDRVFYMDKQTNSLVGCQANLPSNNPSLYCWASILQNKYPNIEIYNLAKCGNSNPSMFRNLLEHSEQNFIKTDLIMFMGTLPDRMDVCDPSGGQIVPWTIATQIQDTSNSDNPVHVAKKMFVSWLYGISLGQYASIQSLLASYCYAQLNDIDFVWSMPLGFKDNPKFVKAVEPLLKYQIPGLIGFDYSGKKDDNYNKHCLCPDHHANELGHEVYFEKVILPYMEAKIKS